MQFWPNTTRTDTIVLSHYCLFFPLLTIGATVGTPCLGCVDTSVVTVFTAQNSIDKFGNEITLEDDAHAVLA